MSWEHKQSPQLPLSLEDVCPHGVEAHKWTGGPLGRLHVICLDALVHDGFVWLDAALWLQARRLVVGAK